MRTHTSSRSMRKQPGQHQCEALDGIDRALATNNRAKVIMACGTGKTLAQLWTSERRGVGQTIVFVPTLSLMSQTCQEWCAQQQGDVLFRYICVCSDETVDALGRVNDVDSDHLQTSLDAEEFKPTTDPAQVRRFLTASGDAFAKGQRTVVFCTYASAPVVGQAMRGIDDAFDLPPFGLGIFDEAHKTVGTDGKLNSFALADGRLPIRQRLFFTATPKIVETAATADDHHALRVVAMDNRHVYGDVAYRLGFSEAARRGLITRFQVIASFVNDANLTPEELLSPDAKRIADTRALQLGMKEVGARKAITFHSRVDKALAFAQSISPSDMPAFHVNGKMATRDRNRQLSAFGRASRGVMTNATCLTEGVDVPTVDVVAFMDPKQDVVGIGQAAGRAMRTAPGKDLGFILVPLRVDLAAGETVEQAIDRGNFHQIIQVLRSLTENDGEEGAWATRLAGALDSHEGAPPLLRLVGFDGASELGSASVDANRIREAISTRILFGEGGFEARVAELQAFKERHGHCNVPARAGGLSYWCGKQRTAARRPGYPEEHRARLSDMGFVWDVFADKESRWFEQLEAFKLQYGHCNVPVKYPGGLGTWVSVQRRTAKRTGYSVDRRARLDAMGFSWEVFADKESRWFEQLEAFKLQYGHCNVSQYYPGGLGAWCSTQRLAVKKAGYPEDRRSRLDAIGFVWAVHSASEERRFKELEAFVKEHGHCNVPKSHPGGLGGWISSQREDARKPGYSDERRKRLDAMGFVWAIRDNEQAEARRLEELSVFVKEHGHCNVPSSYPGGLGRWVAAQRRRADMPSYPDDRRARLDALGFMWGPRSSKSEHDSAGFDDGEQPSQ
ncbi:Helicase associated domain protein [uncultured Variovorax sp.]|uniref:DEAD/DEAH box helicase n=1 Tax=uncultured Variovorax sp. TaxID=114708 RepID=UPI00345D51A9